MPALVFDWNNAGFNDNASMPNCRNGVTGQTRAALIASLIGSGAVSHNNILFSFPNGVAIGNWALNLGGTLAIQCWTICLIGHMSIQLDTQLDICSIGHFICPNPTQFSMVRDTTFLHFGFILLVHNPYFITC